MKWKAFSILLAIILFFNIVPAPFLSGSKVANAEEQICQTPINISNTSQAAQNPNIAVDKENSVHAVWEEQNWDQAISRYKRDIFYAKQNQGAWSQKVKINSTAIESKTGKPSFPKIAVDSIGNVYIVWYEEVVHPDGTWETFVDYTSFFNVNDSQPTRIASANHIYAPNLALMADSNNNIHLIWVDNAGAGSTTDVLKHSINIKGIWTTPFIVRQNNWGISDIDATLDNNGIYLLWVDGANQRTNIAYSEFIGFTWLTAPDAPFIIEQGNILESVNGLAITGSVNDNLSIVWTRSGNNSTPRILCSQLIDHLWLPPKQIFVFPQGIYPTYIDLASSIGELHLVFAIWDSSTTLSKLQYSSYSGSEWSSLANISTDSLKNALQPSTICNSNGQLQCVCSGYEPNDNYNIYYLAQQEKPNSQRPVVTISSISNDQEPLVEGFAESAISNIRSIEYQVDGTDPAQWNQLSPLMIREGSLMLDRYVRFAFKLTDPSDITAGAHSLNIKAIDMNGNNSDVVSFPLIIQPYINIIDNEPANNTIIEQHISINIVATMRRIAEEYLSDNKLSPEEKQDIEKRTLIHPIKIYVKYESNDDIDMDSIRLFVDGIDRTSYAVIGQQELFLQNYWFSGNHTAKIFIKTKNEAVVEKEWGFTVKTDYAESGLRGIGRAIWKLLTGWLGELWSAMEAEPVYSI